MAFDVGPFALRGTIPDANDGQGGFCPRRTVLDHLLVSAAAEAGAVVRERFSVEGLLFEGDRVVGISGRSDGGRAVEERGRLVIGADGVHSMVAKAVRAPEYHARPVLACAYYSYFSGVDQQDLELFVRERTAFGGAPTNGGLNLVMVNWPTAMFPTVREDIERALPAVARACRPISPPGSDAAGGRSVVWDGWRSQLFPQAVR